MKAAYSFLSGFNIHFPEMEKKTSLLLLNKMNYIWFRWAVVTEKIIADRKIEQAQVGKTRFMFITYALFWFRMQSKTIWSETNYYKCCYVIISPVYLRITKSWQAGWGGRRRPIWGFVYASAKGNGSGWAFVSLHREIGYPDHDLF